MATKRLEYIDALRGFTMILVVFAHIINYGYHITDAKAETMDTFNNLFIRFRMPLFFFISGFVLYKQERIWDKPFIKRFYQKEIFCSNSSHIYFLISFRLFI